MKMNPQLKKDRAQAKNVVNKFLSNKHNMETYKKGYKEDYGYDITDANSKRRLVRLYTKRIANRLERKL